MAEELIDSEGDLRAPRDVDAMRGTILVSTFRWLRERDLETRYREALDPAARPVLLETAAADWVPIALGLAHYDALDSLALSHDVCIALGADVSHTINGVFLNTVARLAGTLGATPFTPLARAAKVYARNFRGGAIAVSRVADTEARFEVRGAPMARSRVHRDTIEGSLLDGCLPFAANAKVSEIIASRSPTSYAYRIRW
jgi:hypothetical protein